MSDLLLSPEHRADVVRVKQALRDARAAFFKESSQENRDKVIEAERIYHEVCCCDPVDYEMHPHYIVLGEMIRTQREIDQQYERVLINMTSVCMDDFENPDICSYYVPVDQVEKLLAQLKLQTEAKDDPCEDRDDTFETTLEENYGTVPERVKIIGIVNVAMYFGSYTKAKWESVMFGPPMEFKEYLFRNNE